MIKVDNPPKPSPLDYGAYDPIIEFIPPVIDARIAVQQGTFTVLHPVERITERAALYIKRLNIDPKVQVEFRCDLHQLGINSSTLFPDIRSLAINQKWVWEEYNH